MRQCPQFQVLFILSCFGINQSLECSSPPFLVGLSTSFSPYFYTSGLWYVDNLLSTIKFVIMCIVNVGSLWATPVLSDAILRMCFQFLAAWQLEAALKLAPAKKVQVDESSIIHLPHSPSARHLQ
jgi:hypothetical protein